MSDAGALAGRMRQNIRLNYAYTALIYAGLDKGVWMLFLSFRGLGLVEIGLVESAYQLACLAFGVPAGAIADLIGRKVCMVLAVVAKILSYVLILSSSGTAGFAAGFVLGALSTVLFQGSSESLTYDSCKIAGLQGSYKKIYGNILFLAFVSAAIGVVAGGFIASYSYEWVYYVSIGVMLCALVPAALFTETRGVAGAGRRPGVVTLFARTARLIADNPLILYLLILSACITVVDMTIYMYCQKYFEGMSVPVYLIGVILCVDSICAALGARYAYLLERFRNRDVILMIPAIILAMYALLALLNTPLVVLMLWTGTVFVVAFWPILSDLINTRVPTENRATVLSVKSQLSSMGVAVVFPVVGLIASQSSLSIAFLWLIAIAIPLIVYCVVKIRKIAF
ncbi:MAG: Major Facilitator Superfamily protein [Methanocella sp. PtaU1.Bin125]|nr:MAG: Major Facilitator Superfamily protein [Methanocella sp. PtaU1.Bin125]